MSMCMCDQIDLGFTFSLGASRLLFFGFYLSVIAIFTVVGDTRLWLCIPLLLWDKSPPLSVCNMYYYSFASLYPFFSCRLLSG